MRDPGSAYYFVMFSRDSHGIGLNAKAGRLLLCAALALAFWLGGDRTIGVERGFYDLSQRLTAGAPDAKVVIVDTGGPEASPWSQASFGALVSRLKAAGALAVVPAVPPGAMVSEQDVSRLRSLIALENRSGSPKATEDVGGGLNRQLADLLARRDQQQATVSAIQSAGNVVLGLGSGTPPVNAAPEVTCGERIAADSGRFADLAAAEQTLVKFSAAGGSLCAAAAALGQLRAVPDRDGIIRLATPLVETSAGRLPSSALAAVSLNGDVPVLPEGLQLLRRFYRATDGTYGFQILPWAEVVTGTRAGAVRGQVVVVGSIEGGGAGSAATPLAADVGPAILAATDVANLQSDDLIVRPAWAVGAELVLVGLLALAAFLVGRLSLPRAALLALVGATLLMLAEMLLITQGLWLHLAGLALFCLTGVALLQFMTHMPSARQRQAAAAAAPGPGVAGPNDELDLGFSVLRQQPTTDRTKQQLYALAMEHGRNRDYARAERVFRHLAARDPGYKDVAAKLEKLSGARGAPPAKKREPTVEPAPARAVEEPAVATRTLGRYELDRVIGRGAMATVYLGRDPTINRRVAIKTLPLAEEFADSDLATARSHFIREAESAGRLNHPNIISIYDAGEDNHVAYLAMEYSEGKPLSHYARLGRLLPPKVVFELMARAADALHYAHAQNVVHRDVKPANLLYDDVADILKLTDFGIARLTDASRTRTGIILGTPSYMSPEQLSASKITGQSDLYSLGVTMYHLLTGSPPFQADSIPRLMEKIVHQKHRPVADVRDDVPPCTDAILDQALAKDPDARFPNGRAMALALRECCSRLPADTL
jgi:eukaryotic-like serine/threonine-protein kinase